MLTMIAKLLKLLNSEADPSQISLAFSFALLSGFLPFFSPLNAAVLLIVFLLRVNLSAYFLGTAVFSAIASLLDPLFHHLGRAVLTTSSLEGLWTTLYQSTVWRLQRFNNSVVMGGIVVSLLLFVPFFFLSNYLIRKYREKVLVWVKRTRVMQFFTASKLYALYEKLS